MIIDKTQFAPRIRNQTRNYQGENIVQPTGLVAQLPPPPTPQKKNIYIV